MNLHEGEDEYVTKTAYNRETGLPRIQQTRLRGMLHAPPTGEPSQVVFDDDGRPAELSWHAFNLEHREDGPASVNLYEGTQHPCVEVYKLEGQPRSPELGPYRVARKRNGEIVKEEFADEHNQLPQSTIEFMINRLEP